MASSRTVNDRRFGRPDEVYAVGAVIIAWNQCESAFAELLRRTLATEWQTARRMFNLLGKQSRIDMLRLEGRRRLTEQEFDRLDASITAYGICLENRNLIAHSRIRMNWKEGGFSLSKTSSKDRLSENKFIVPTPEMMVVANDISDLAEHAGRLSLAIWAGPDRYLIAGGKKRVHVPLPDRFPRPRKLTPLSPVDPPASRSPHRSSGA